MESLSNLPQSCDVRVGGPAVFTCYVKTYRPDVNLFVDHSHIVQLEALRAGPWGTADMWGRIVTFKPS
jgi:phosphosulfolactate synthase (CoM biosynthesis protein A)